MANKKVRLHRQIDKKNVAKDFNSPLSPSVSTDVSGLPQIKLLRNGGWRRIGLLSNSVAARGF